MFLSAITNAQEDKKYNFQYGVASLIPFVYANDKFELGKNGVAGAYTHFQYIVAGKENSTFTIGSHPILAGRYLNDNGYVTKLFNVNLPIVAEYNLGNNASAASTNRFGLYVGGGYTYIYSYYSVDGFSSSISDNGPIGNFGLRAHMLNRDYSFNLFSVKSLKYDGLYYGGVGFTVALKKTESTVNTKSPRKGNIFGNSGGFFDFLLPRDNGKF
jgi:hypothetical protein